MLGLAHQYGFVELEAAISDYLKAILNIRNVCLIYDIANMYCLKTLCQTSLEFMDKNAAEIIQSDAFLTLSEVSRHIVCHLDTQTLKNYPLGHPFFYVWNFVKCLFQA